MKAAYQEVTLFEGDLNLCEAFGEALHCPRNPTTQFAFSIVETIPPIAPTGGPYEGQVVIRDQDNAQVTCVAFKFDMQGSESKK